MCSARRQKVRPSPYAGEDRQVCRWSSSDDGHLASALGEPIRSQEDLRHRITLRRVAGLTGGNQIVFRVRAASACRNVVVCDGGESATVMAAIAGSLQHPLAPASASRGRAACARQADLLGTPSSLALLGAAMPRTARTFRDRRPAVEAGAHLYHQPTGQAVALAIRTADQPAAAFRTTRRDGAGRTRTGTLQVISLASYQLLPRAKKPPDVEARVACCPTAGGG